MLELIAQGQSNAGIAKTLWITHGAVEKHIKHIFAKLGIPPPLTPTDASSPQSHSSKPVNLRWPEQWPLLVLHLLIRVAVLQGELQEIPPRAPGTR